MEDHNDSEEHIWYHEGSGHWHVGHSFIIELELGGGIVIDYEIPEGYDSDLGSVPRFLWSFIAPFELGIKECITHDKLYRENFRDRKFCDDFWLKVMRRKKIVKWKRELAYKFVRAFGWKAWNKNAKNKRARVDQRE